MQGKRGSPEERCYDLSGVGVRLRGVPAGAASLLDEAWSDFAASPLPGRPALDAAVRTGALPAACARLGKSGSFESALDERNAAYRLREGTVRVGRDGGAEILLRECPDPTQLYDLLNLLVPALAWLLPARGTVLLHAAGVVLEGSAHVLVGAEGSGKTTWAGLAKQAGASFLSDDLVFVAASAERVEALSLPFRANHPRPMAPGRWPVAAILFPEWGKEARLGPADRMRARGRLLANLPYLSRTLPDVAAAERIVERLIERVPLRTLTFAPDPSFVPLLRGLAGGRADRDDR